MSDELAQKLENNIKPLMQERWKNNACEEDKPAQIKFPTRLEKAGFPERYKGLNLKTFPTETQEKYEFVLKVQDYLEKWKKHHNAIFEGLVGTGKTGMAISIGKELIQKQQNVKFVDCSRLAVEYSRDYKSDPLFKKYKNYDVLILDDIDKANTEGMWKLFFTLIKYRYDNLKCTIITTNVKLRASQNALIKPIYDRLQQPPSRIFTLTDWESLRREE